MEKIKKTHFFLENEVGLRLNLIIEEKIKEGKIIF